MSIIKRHAIYARLNGNTPSDQMVIDRERWPGNQSLTGFLQWSDAHIARHLREVPSNNLDGTIADVEVFDEWLAANAVPLNGAPTVVVTVVRFRCGHLSRLGPARLASTAPHVAAFHASTVLGELAASLAVDGYAFKVEIEEQEVSMLEWCATPEWIPA